jgi:hypothetical protein
MSMSAPTPHPSVSLSPTPLPSLTATAAPVDLGLIDWGSVADWVTGVAAILALIGAAFTVYFAAGALRTSQDANKITLAAYERDVEVRREAQARFVYSTTEVLAEVRPSAAFAVSGEVAIPGGLAHSDGRSGWIGDADGLIVRVTIHNGSDELIGPYSIGIYDYQTGASPEGDIRSGRRDPILPSGSESTALGAPTAHGRGHLLRGDIIFRDSSGTVWRRRGAEPIEEYIDTPPWQSTF